MGANSIADLQRIWRSILLIFIALLLPISSYAQDASQNKDAPKAKKPHLEFKLIALTPTACIGAPLKLRLEVTNVGQETIELNRAYFWSSYQESPPTPEGEDKDREGFITHVWPRSTNEDIFLLLPGKTYVAHSYWAFDEEVTKFGPGNYTLEIRNSKVQFALQDCERKELRSKDEHQR